MITQSADTLQKWRGEEGKENKWGHMNEDRSPPRILATEVILVIQHIGY